MKDGQHYDTPLGGIEGPPARGNVSSVPEQLTPSRNPMPKCERCSGATRSIYHRGECPRPNYDAQGVYLGKVMAMEKGLMDPFGDHVKVLKDTL